MEEAKPVAPLRASLPPLEWGSAVLVARAGRSATRLAEELDGFTAKSILTRLYAAAEMTVSRQASLQDDVLAHVRTLVSTGFWKAHAYFEHLSYDETGLQLRTYYATDEIDKEVGKVFVLEHSWCMVLECRPSSASQASSDVSPGQFLVLQGVSAPTIRTSKSASGSYTAAVLSTGPQPPKDIESVFDLCVRVTETDEGPSNPVAEAHVLAGRMSDKKHNKVWSHAFVWCLAHKTHSCCTKLWGLQEQILSVIIHSCKTLLTAGAWGALRDRACELMLERFTCTPGDAATLDPDAISFRKILHSYYLPATSSPKKRATVLAALKYFNGDLRQDKVTHLCGGCCANAAQSREKASFLFRCLFQAIRPKMFAKNNWIDWSSTLIFFSFADAFHHVIVDAYQTAFLKTTLEPLIQAEVEPAFEYLAGSASAAGPPQQAGAEADDDAFQRMREEHAHSLKVSLTGMRRGLWHDIALVRLPLEPARILMQFLTHSVSEHWEHTEMNNMWQSGSRRFRALLLHNGDILPVFFRDLLQQYKDSALWNEFEQTEYMRSRIFRFCFRPGAVAHQLIRIRSQGFPFRLLALLEEGPDLHQKAEEVLKQPTCMRDSFSANFLAKYNSVDKLLGQCAKNILFTLARLLRCSTFSTERLHSKNLRQAKSRTQTHTVNIKDLGLPHVGLCGASFAVSELTAEQHVAITGKKKIGRPKKRPLPEAADGAGPVKRTNPGAGGAWRAFLHQRLAGRQFTPELVTAAQQSYHALTAEERAYYVRLGRAGLGEEQVWDSAAFSFATSGSRSGGLKFLY